MTHPPVYCVQDVGLLDKALRSMWIGCKYKYLAGGMKFETQISPLPNDQKKLRYLLYFKGMLIKQNVMEEIKNIFLRLTGSLKNHTVIIDI